MDINDCSRRVCGYSWAESEADLWLPMADKNGICRIDRISGEVKTVMPFPEYNIDNMDLYFYCLCKDNKVIFIPHLAREVAVYDIKEERLEMVPLKHPDSFFEGQYGESYKFVDGLLYQNSIYMFGYGYPAIVKMGIDTKKITYLTEWMTYYPYEKVYSEFFAEGHAQIGSDVYLGMKNTNILIRLDLQNDQIEALPVENHNIKIMYVTTYKSNVIMLSWDDSTVKIDVWDPTAGVIKEHNIETDKNVKGLSAYWMPVVTENWMYLFSLHEDKVYTINLGTGEHYRHKELEKIISDAESVGLMQVYTVLSARNVAGKIVFQTGRDCCFYEYDPSTGKTRCYSYLITDNSYMKKYYTAKLKGNLIEEADMSLPYFLSGIQLDQ